MSWFTSFNPYADTLTLLDLDPDNISFNEILKLNNLKKITSFFKKIKNDKKISIFSDYDVDGACAASIFKKYLAQFDIEVFVYIPNILNEGY